MRLRLLISLFLVVWLTLVFRVYFISIKSGSYYEELAQRNTIKSEPILPVRGTIYDRNGEPLAVNKLGFSVSLAPHMSSSRHREELEAAFDVITELLPGVDREKLFKTYMQNDSPYSHDQVEVIPFIPYEEILPHFTHLSLHDRITVQPTTLRYYPHGMVASHVLGYVSKADKRDGQLDSTTRIIGFQGKAGVEKFYNDQLQGELGHRTFQVTAFNKEIDELDRKEPSQNQDLVLSLDIRLQELIDDLFKGKAGAAIVMDARDGAILAAGSFPEYDINKFVTGITRKEWQEMIEDFNHPFLNKISNSLYPPGSVIKPTVALAFLENPFIDRYTNFYCTGAFEFGERDFRCWKQDGHGKVDARMAIRESCDIYFYKGSYKVGIDKIAEKLRTFGYGEKSGLDLPDEFIGTVPDKEWKMQKYGKKWFVGETFITSIGQGSFLVTPIQVARNTALLATGEKVTPHFAMEIRGRKNEPETQEVFSPSDKRNIGLVRQGMKDVTHHPRGTATYHLHTRVETAGKTGTAQVVGIPQGEKKRMKETELEYYQRSHAWLTTYAPADDPKYVVMALVEHGGYGGHAAGPIVSKIYDKMVKLGYLR